jgi:hypothetical protein
MKNDKDRNFEQYLSQLMKLLQKMIKNLPDQEGFTSPLKSDKAADANFNVFLFNFLPMVPMSPEELEEMEEILDAQSAAEDRGEELTCDLNPADKDFLRKNGIRF